MERTQFKKEMNLALLREFSMRYVFVYFCFILLESFGQNYPEVSTGENNKKFYHVTLIYSRFQHNDGYLDSGSEALTCAFNRRGNYLAVGCNDGRIAVWDFMTRGIAIIFSSHTHPITSLRYVHVISENYHSFEK